MNHTLEKEALLLSVSAEIWVHLLVYAAVVVPLVAVALPVVLVSFGTFEIFQSIGALWNGTKDPDVQVAYGQLTFFVGALLLARFFSGCRESICTDRRTEAELADRMRQPKGAAGQTLRDTIDRLWRLAPSQGVPAPEITWYSGFQVAAHARSTKGSNRICVSSALWDRVTKQDLTSELILAHEIAHVLHHDSRTFRHLSVVLHGIRSTLRFSRAFTICATAIVLCFSGVANVIHSEPMWAVARLELATLVSAALCFLLLVLSDQFVRRYASFIVAMMEVRADLGAALWTVGLDSFAERLESDAALHRSTAADLRQSFFSPDMTHISESERLALIRTPDRLFTPKLRYFAWSVVLALLLPLNPISPLLFNGAIDHVVIASTAAALYGATMTMLVLSSFSRTLSWERVAVLSTAVCCVLGSTSFNLYEIGYLLTHYSVAIANDSGFGRDPIVWTDIKGDFVMVAHALANKAIDGISGWWILVVVPLTMVAMKLVRPVAQSISVQPSKLLAVGVTLTTFSVALIAGRDSHRSDLYDYLSTLIPIGLQAACKLTEPIRLAMPAIAGLISVFFMGLMLKRTRSTKF